MANWIKAIYFVVILAWVIYVLSDDAVIFFIVIVIISAVQLTITGKKEEQL